MVEAAIQPIEIGHAPASFVPDKCPASGWEFYERENIAAAIPTGTEAEIIAFDVPTGMRGVLEWLGCGGPAEACAANVVWKLRRGFSGLGGVAGMDDWENYLPGAMNPADWFPFRLILEEGERVAIRVANASGVLIPIGTQAFLKGFVYPANMLPDGGFPAAGAPPAYGSGMADGQMGAADFTFSELGRNLAQYGRPTRPTLNGIEPHRSTRLTYGQLFLGESR